MANNPKNVMSDIVYNKNLFINGYNPNHQPHEYYETQRQILHNNNNKLPPNSRHYKTNIQNEIQANYDNGYNNSNRHFDGNPHVPVGYDETFHQKDIYRNENLNKYDPYVGYKFKKGLLMDSHQRRRIKIQYIDINSRFRIKKPIAQFDEPILLENNPLHFKDGDDTIFISHKHSGFKKGDKILLSGINKRTSILKTVNNNTYTIEMLENYNFAKIYCKHGIPLHCNNSLEIIIEGIRGELHNNYIGNIPINVINTKHTIKLSLTNDDIHGNINDVNESMNDANYFDKSSDYFFILLPINLNTNYALSDYNFKISFLFINCIHVNNFYDGQNELDNYHIIQDVCDDGYTIQLKCKSYTENENIQDGGNHIYVSKMHIACQGYRYPNNYAIDLQNVFHNVVSIRLVSTEIPNIRQLVTTCNNKIYWNNLNDNKLHSITIPCGNYKKKELVCEIKNQIIKSKMNMHVDYNNNTKIIEFRSFNRTSLKNPIISETIDKVREKVILTIKHQNHNIGIMDNIVINDSLDYKGIEQKYINSIHKPNVINNDIYTIELPSKNYNQRKGRRENNLQFTVDIPIPLKLRFNMEDSIKNMFAENQNNACYNTEQYDDAHINSSCKLNTNDNAYIIMTLKPIKTFYTLGKIKHAFAKIQLCKKTKKILYDTFIPMEHIFNDPLRELYKLDIGFHNYDGTLFDFGELDHSFTLEIVTVDDVPENTQISANTGKNYNCEIP